MAGTVSNQRYREKGTAGWLYESDSCGTTINSAKSGITVTTVALSPVVALPVDPSSLTEARGQTHARGLRKGHKLTGAMG